MIKPVKWEKFPGEISVVLNWDEVLRAKLRRQTIDETPIGSKLAVDSVMASTEPRSLVFRNGCPWGNGCKTLSRSSG